MYLPELNHIISRLTVNQKLAIILAVLLVTTGINVGVVNLYQRQTDSLEASADLAKDQQVRAQEMARFSQQLTVNPSDTTTIQTRLNQTIHEYDRGLSQLESRGGGTGFGVRSVPTELTADIQANRELWTEYRAQLNTVRTQQAVNSSYAESATYIATHQQDIDAQLDRLEDQYESAAGDFSSERELVSRLQQLNGQISSYTTLIANNEQLGRSDFGVQGSKLALERRLTQFDRRLNMLKTGGKYQETRIQSPPAGVTDALNTLSEEWEPYRTSGQTIANRERYNTEYAAAVQFIQTNTQTLVERSDTVARGFESVADRRAVFLQRLLFALFGINVVVFTLSLRFSNRYVGKPLTHLTDVADEIASGQISGEEELVSATETEQEPRDEIEQLKRSFSEMRETLQLVSQQADALAAQRFDDPVLAESVPGEFGDNLQAMQADLKELIKEQEAAQEELESQKAELQTQKEKLERQNERLDQFASLVSHDLRNPLGTAKMYLDFAKDTGEEEDFDSVRESLERMDTMIDDLLTFARTGGAVTETETVEIAAIARSAWDMAATHDAELSVEVEWARVDADPDKLLHVFENLFRNASQHGTPDTDQTVNITVGRIATMPTATRSSPDEKKGFYIADDGVGIPEEDREDIFEHGYSTSEQGNGFGMSIVKQVVDAHGWEITVTESEDGGARFEITGV